MFSLFAAAATVEIVTLGVPLLILLLMLTPIVGSPLREFVEVFPVKLMARFLWALSGTEYGSVPMGIPMPPFGPPAPSPAAAASLFLRILGRGLRVVLVDWLGDWAGVLVVVVKLLLVLLHEMELEEVVEDDVLVRLAVEEPVALFTLTVTMFVVGPEAPVVVMMELRDVVVVEADMVTDGVKREWEETT